MAISLFHMSGSSPYTWGAHCLSTCDDQVTRITPIYMGSTNQPANNLRIVKDHPPYTWGALDMNTLTTTQNRITPIYMGSTPGHRQLARRRQDHPHIHGEHDQYAIGHKG